MLSTVLIANRGEIACRVIKTAKRLGLNTVAVYSDADKDALHVKMADSAYYIGAAPSKDSYLKAEVILDVAKRAKADCIHPGYGFLSENAQFAAQCEANNIAFIGPLSKSIEAMGSKTRAKEIMASANVPLVPGYYGDNQDLTFLRQEADKIGYPVLIKAAFGGGGKGMRVVNNADEFDAALAGAKREAIAGFGNDLVLLERFVDKPRHVEVQVFADSHGNCVYLGDRDCSLQRRHQKVIEEAPAPDLSDALRQEMGEAAVRCAKAIDYRGAGTVEFLLCGEEFFFMEMNTRLQVEHPVTEMVTGQDLVAWQLAVAAGEPLPLSQEQISLTGHSFEARIYAEDPTQDFMPYSGKLTALHFPASNEQIRIDTGVQNNDEISSFYDPMIAKLIVKGDNRKHALQLLKNALESVHLAGLKCNVGFLHTLATHPEFVAGAPDTHFIDSQSDTLTQQSIATNKLLAMAAFAYYRHLQQQARSPWQRLTGFKLNSINEVRLPFSDYQGVLHASSNGISADIEGEHFTLAGTCEQQGYRFTINNEQCFARCVVEPHQITVMYGAVQFIIALDNKHYVSEHENDAAPLAAPLNGTVVKHLLPLNSQVEKGDAVIVIEAMKMEYTLNAPHAGVLTQYYFGEGELVSHGALLAEVSAEASEENH